MNQECPNYQQKVEEETKDVPHTVNNYDGSKMATAANRKREAKAYAKLRKKQDSIAVGKKEKVVVSERVFKLTKKNVEPRELH